LHKPTAYARFIVRCD